MKTLITAHSFDEFIQCHALVLVTTSARGGHTSPASSSHHCQICNNGFTELCQL